MDTLQGAHAEYCVCPENTAFHIPEAVKSEEAATILLAIFTAAVGLYHNLDLLLPFARSDEEFRLNKVPLIVNVASRAIGSFAVKLAKLNPRFFPILSIAGDSIDHARQTDCDFVIDRRSKDVAKKLHNALSGEKAQHVFDAAHTMANVKYLLPMMAKCCRHTRIAKGKEFEAQIAALKGANVALERIWVGSVHEDKQPGAKMVDAVLFRFLDCVMTEGRSKGHPYKRVRGGLNGVKDALTTLMDRKGGNEEFVTCITDTK